MKESETLDDAKFGSNALICLYSRTAFDRITHVYWCIETKDKGTHFIGVKIPVQRGYLNIALKLVTKDLEEWINKLIETNAEVDEFSLDKIKLFIDSANASELMWLKNSKDISPIINTLGVN